SGLGVNFSVVLLDDGSRQHRERLSLPIDFELLPHGLHESAFAFENLFWAGDSAGGKKNVLQTAGRLVRRGKSFPIGDRSGTADRERERVHTANGNSVERALLIQAQSARDTSGDRKRELRGVIEAAAHNRRRFREPALHLGGH